jgi:hypothetical protein
MTHYQKVMNIFVLLDFPQFKCYWLLAFSLVLLKANS